MSVTVTKFAIGPDMARLEAAIAALIALGYQPAGDPTILNGQFVQRMDKSDSVQTDASADGAIAIKNGTVVISKGTAAALTLAAPTAAQAGTRIRVISATAAAHTITSTDKIDDGVTGGAKDLATFAAFAGASIELEAVNLKWAVVSKNAVTITGS